MFNFVQKVNALFAINQVLNTEVNSEESVALNYQKSQIIGDLFSIGAALGSVSILSLLLAANGVKAVFNNNTEVQVATNSAPTEVVERAVDTTIDSSVDTYVEREEYDELAGDAVFLLSLKQANKNKLAKIKKEMANFDGDMGLYQVSSTELADYKTEINNVSLDTRMMESYLRDMHGRMHDIGNVTTATCRIMTYGSVQDGLDHAFKSVPKSAFPAKNSSQMINIAVAGNALAESVALNAVKTQCPEHQKSLNNLL